MRHQPEKNLTPGTNRVAFDGVTKAGKYLAECVKIWESESRRVNLGLLVGR